MREVEDTVLFSSRSISGKELGIEQFNSPKIVQDDREGGREGGKTGNVGDKDGVCLCVREKRQDGGETVIS